MRPEELPVRYACSCGVDCYNSSMSLCQDTCIAEMKLAETDMYISHVCFGRTDEAMKWRTGSQIVEEVPVMEVETLLVSKGTTVEETGRYISGVSSVQEARG